MYEPSYVPTGHYCMAAPAGYCMHDRIIHQARGCQTVQNVSEKHAPSPSAAIANTHRPSNCSNCQCGRCGLCVVYTDRPNIAVLELSPSEAISEAVPNSVASGGHCVKVAMDVVDRVVKKFTFAISSTDKFLVEIKQSTPNGWTVARGYV